jgi:serine/threonine protein kinase
MEPARHKQKSGESRLGLEAGKLVDNERFRLKKLIGQGKAGEVWLAYDNRLHEFVALKFFFPQFSENPEVLEKLRREILKSRKLSHPNIVRIYDLHQEKEKLPFIAMEYVDGPNLHQLCLTRPNGVLTWDFISPLLRQLVSAIQYAHGENIIHHDIKPSNLLINSQKNLKLSDFGIARVTMSLSHYKSVGFSAGEGYISPQQAENEPASFSDDIYAIGATLYNLLTGTPPFYKGDIKYQILHTKPDSLAERILELNINNLIPPSLEEFVQLCLEKDPSKRPSDYQLIYSWIDKIDKEYADLKNSEVIPSPVKTELSDPADISLQSEEVKQGGLKPVLPFVFGLLFCIGLLIFSTFVNKVPTDSKNKRPSLPPHDSESKTKPSLVIADSKTVKDFTESTNNKKSSVVPVNTNKTNSQSIVRDNIFRQEKIARGKLIAEISKPLTAITRAEEGSWVIVSDSEGYARMLNSKSGSIIWENRVCGFPIKALAMMSDNRRFIVGDSAGNISICSISRSEVVSSVNAHKEEIVCIATSANRYFATADAGGIIKVWDSISGRFISEIKSMQPPVNKLAISPDGKILAAGKQNGVINLYLLPLGDMQKSFIAHKGGLSEIFFNPADSQFYSLGREDRTLKHWDLISISEKKTFRPQAPLREGFLTMRFSGKSPIAVIVSDANYGYVINPETFSLIKRLKFDIHKSPVTGIEVFPDNTVITIGSDGFVCRWEIE